MSERNSFPTDRPLYGLVDIGGTKTLVALSDGKSIHNMDRMRTRVASGPEGIIDDVASRLRHLVESAGRPLGTLTRIGLSIPGPLDPQTGVVGFAANLGWHQYPVGPTLAQRMDGVPVLVEDDANCGGLGEAVYGAGVTASHQVYLAIGTGVGGALILERRLYRGAHSAAGEVGHMVLDPDGPECSCGNRGCLETLISGSAVAREGRIAAASGASQTLAKTARSVNAITSEDVFQAAAKGDPASQRIIAHLIPRLGIALGNLAKVLDPDLFVLGGGVMSALQSYLPAVEEAFQQQLFPQQPSLPSLRLAQLGSASPLWGVLSLLLNH